ncbi:DUF3772 domain-containing protein [Primorskyibacter sp. S187A]|uniref:DUF3772 domain-containing protein n=1 Tax=Primorskyibacter sp. S187A TaxID=3415130 RepID=UPI003C7A7AC2
MRHLVFALLCVLAFGLAPQAIAQVQSVDEAQAAAQDGPEELIPGIDLQAWQALATRAEAAIDAGSASTPQLESLRAEIAEFRAAFLDAQSLNAARITSLARQIEAMGPVPESGEEAPNIAARRAALEEELAVARAPVVAAEENFNWADGLIAELDSIIRTRQTDALLEVGPSPLNPALWGPAYRDLTSSLTGIVREATDALALPSRQSAILGAAPVWLGLTILGLVLLIRGRAWARSAGVWVLERSGRGARIWSFLVSVGQILLPITGIFALVEAVQITQILGLRGNLLIEYVPLWALTILGARWVADRVFSEHDGDRMLPMEQLHRVEARGYASLLAVLSVLRGAISVLAERDGYSDGTLAVLDFPILCLTALLLFRFGQLLSRKVIFEREADEPVPMRARFMQIIGRVAVIVALLSPLLAVFGYGAAARALVYPAATTLLLAGALLVLQRFCGDVYRFITGKSANDEDTLVTVLIAFALTIGALPLLALVWGARTADITEVWSRFLQGVSLGGTRIQPTDFLTFVVVFVVLYSATKLLQASLRNTVLPKTQLDQGARTAVISGVGYIGIFLAALISISVAGIDLSALAIVAGALSVGIGFGLQNIVNNFVSGIILLIERPIAEGDWIEVGGQMGYVRDISVRSTRIETFDRTDVIVPNGDLIAGTVTNFTRGNSIGRLIVPVGVAYGTDTRKVESVLLSIARQHDMVLMNPEPSVVFQGFGADSMDFEIRAILRDVNYMLSVKSEMNHEIAMRFAEEGIEIPFAQRDVWLRNPEALAPNALAPNAQDNPDLASTDSAPNAETQS